MNTKIAFFNETGKKYTYIEIQYLFFVLLLTTFGVSFGQGDENKIYLKN